MHFLEQEKPASAKDYILSLFEKNDVVILCERDHREMAQYKLMLEVVGDPYFVNEVGVVFTEVGGQSLNPALNAFLQNEDLSEKEVDRQVLDFQRNCIFPLWEKPNFSTLIKGVYRINKHLTRGEKVKVYPTDVLYIEGEPTADKVEGEIKNMMVRDSLIANYIVDRYSAMKKENPKSKALVIMNYRHAYRYDMASGDGKKTANVGRFLFDAYPERVANVLINCYNNAEKFGAISDGKWDAAFQLTKLENAGFSFSHSPFGDDYFESWPAKNNFTYKDVFTGFAFYMPIEKFEMGMGVPHLMEDGFYDEYVKRNALYYEALYKMLNVSQPIPALSKEKVMSLNETRVSKLHTLDQVKTSIEQWLK